MPSVQVPSVDFSPFLTNDGVMASPPAPPTPMQLHVAKQIHETCCQHGFLHMTNIGLSPDLIQDAFQGSQELFDLPLDHKECVLKRLDTVHNTGYSPFATERLNRARNSGDMKECFNIRFGPWNSNDFTGCPDGFQEMAEKLQVALTDAARRYSIACALALGMHNDYDSNKKDRDNVPGEEKTATEQQNGLLYFHNTLNRMDLCTIRMLHYPPVDPPASSSSSDASLGAIRIGEHTDFGAYTFLLLKDETAYKGLQIKPVLGGEVGGIHGGETSNDWLDVAPPPRSDPSSSACSVGAIVNTGALMARWTNDTWRATAHRVIVPNDEEAYGSHRYTIACFIDPDADSVVDVHPHFLQEVNAEGEVIRTFPKKYSQTTGLEYLLEKLRQKS
mmetsp:Transcript_2263/g.4174  ORF Transcript_2263/g.4174 Transcript_2263/m.4174 type:complete len:389 (-) Transcript_2263:94-1260(-)